MLTRVFNKLSCQLDQLKVRQKLIVFLLTPFFATLYFSATTLYDKQQKLQNAKTSKALVTLAVQLADLVHELQKERGLSAGLVDKEDKTIFNKLIKQRILTDNRLTILNKHLSQLDVKKNRWGNINDINLFKAELKQLSSIRGQIDNFDKNYYFKYYSSLNAIAINLTYQLQILTDNIDLAQEASAFTILLWLQERAGQERGILNEIFSTHHVNAERIQQQETLKAEQDALAKNYFIVAPTEYQKQLNDKLENLVINDIFLFRKQIEKMGKKLDLLNALHTLINHGRLIHNIEYSVKKTGEYSATQFIKLFPKTKKLISQYKQQPGLTQEEIDLLDVIETSLEKYRWQAQELKNSSLVENRKKNLSNSDDIPAINAISRLQELSSIKDVGLWWEKASHRINLINEVNNNIGKQLYLRSEKTVSATKTTLITYSLIVLFTALLTTTLGALLLRRLTYAIENISNSMREIQLSGDFHRELEITGNDEISEIAKSFNNLIIERRKSDADQAQLQRELQQSQKMESLGRLTGGIAHDFNNLLSIILGYAELGQNIKDRKSAAYFSTIQDAGQRGAKLISQMLTFTRQDSIDDEPIYLDKAIEENLNILRSSLPSSITIDINLDKDTPATMMNKTQFSQALLNLVINARDAMNGKGQLKISLRYARNLNTECVASHKPLHGDWLELSVSDTGSGIAPEIVDNIFTPYFTTKEVGKGSGLGLAAVYGIVMRHKAHILLETNPNGTNFRLLFPPYQAEIFSTPPSPKQTPVAPGEKQHILLVDDEPNIGLYLEKTLQANNYQTSLFSDSRSALAAFTNEPKKFAMVISDQTMPYITGLELIASMRHVQPELPAILCSGFSEEINSDDAKKQGICYLAKPTSSKDLLKMIELCLNTRKQPTCVD